MSVRERPPQELRSIKSLPMVVGHECMSNVSTMLDNFQTTSMQHLRSLIGERMRHTAPLEAKETPEFVMNEKNRKLLQTKNVSDIEKFLSKADARTSQDFPLYMISDQIAKICSAQSSYGLSLCFASYIKSFAVLCDFLLHEESWKEGKKDKKLANHAIDILLKSKLPPLFYPDVNSRVLMQVDFGDITPVCPTAITSTESMLYVGCPGPVIKAIPLSRTQKQEVTNIEIPELPDKRYSLVTHNGVLILSSSKEPPLHIDPNEKVFMKLQVSHYGHRPMVVPKFGPPVVTDGEFFYSIAYSEAKVKTFKLEMDGIFFVSAVKLTAQKDELMEPFKEILPPGQKKKCSIATNGIYIAFLFRREGITICRIFLLRNGAHHQDVVLNGVDDIDSWCFDGFRPAHCILRKGRAVFLDGQYTLPKWLVGFTEPPENPKVTTGKPDDIISAVSQAMAIFISRVLGTEVPLPINMHNQYYKNSMEKCICKFIDQDNRYAAQSLIALLGLKMIRGDTDLSPEDFIRRLFECYDDPKYEYLHRQIVFTVVSSLDTFFQACPEFTSKVLLRVLNSKEYINISCKYLPRSQFLLNALTAESLTRLCDMTLKTTYMFDEESISLLKEIQYSFVAKGNFDSQLMCILYVGKLCDQLTDDYSHVLNDDWTPQRFATTVSFILFHELVQLVRAVCDSQPLNLELARRLFVVGSLPHPVLSPETEAICKTFTQALFVSIMLYVNHIKNDTNFYALPSTMNGRNRNTEKVGCEFPTGACGISESLSQAICRTVSLACCENVLKDEIVDAIHSVFQLVVSGDVTEEEVIDRCHCIDAIQPQLFRNVIRFLTEGGRCHVVEDPNQCCSVQLLSNLEQPFSETMKATLAYFLDDLYDVRQHFVILPPEYLSKFIQAFDLRFNLPICWFPVDLRINAKWIADMSFDMLVSCFDNVLALASRIENVELLHKTEIVSSEIYNSAIREDLIRKLMILRIAIKHDLSAPMPSHHIFIQCVQIGDYEVVYQVIEIMKVLLASEKYNGLELVMFLFKCIGGFLSGESNIFLVQREYIHDYRIVMLICSLFRVLERENHQLLHKILRSVFDGNMSTGDYLAVFAIFNTIVDTVRPGVKISLKFDNYIIEGTVVSESQGRIVLDSKLSYDMSDVTYLKVLHDEPLGDEFIVESAHLLKRAVVEFTEINAFKYACLADLMKVKQFRDMFTYEEVAVLCRDPKRDDRGLPFLLSALADTWAIRYPLMPLFAFDTNETLYEENTIMEIDIFGEDRPREVSDMVTTEKREGNFTSTMVHSHSYSEIIFENYSARQFQIQIHACCDKCGFISNPFEVKKNASLKVMPKSMLVEVTSDDVTTHVMIPSRCDLIYYSMDLEGSSVVHYVFRSDCKYQKPESLGDGVIMRLDENLENIPFRMGLQWKLSHIEEVHSNIARLLMLDILREYLDFDGERVISAKNCKSIIRLVLDILNELDSKPFGPLLAFPDYFVGQENKGLYSFIVQVLKFLKNHEDQNSLFVAELANLSTNDIVNTVSASNSSALIVDQLLKKDIFDKCFYLTDLSFSMDKPVDAKKVFLVPSDDLVGSSLDMVRDLRHRVTLLCELAQCGETLTKAMQRLSSALDEVKAAAYLKPIVGHLIFSAQEVSTPTKCVTEQLANAGCSNLSCTKECFMLCRANSNLFPLVFWVENGLLSPQSSQCKQTTDAVVSFPVSSQTGYVLLCVSGASQDDIFEVSTSDSFSADIQTLSSSVPLVAPAASLYVRAKSKHCDISKAKFFWKHLNLHSVDLDRVKCEVGQWSTSDSNQLLLTFSDFSPDRWSFTPLSARFSLDTGALFFSILMSLRERSSTDFLCDHTMCYDLTRLHSDEVRLSVFHRLFPNFSRASMLELLSEDPLSDCEKAGILALAFSSHVEVPFNVPYSFCETLCDPTSILGSIFHAVLGASPVPPFTPLFIRSQCCSTPVTRADLEPLIIFRNIDPQPKSLLLSTLDAMPPYSLNLLIERATGIWGLPALRCSRHPHIIITSSDQPNTVTFHPSLHLVAIGHFTSPADFVSQLTQL